LEIEGEEKCSTDALCKKHSRPHSLFCLLAMRFITLKEKISDPMLEYNTCLALAFAIHDFTEIYLLTGRLSNLWLVPLFTPGGKYRQKHPIKD